MASAMRAFAAPPNAPRAQDDKLVDHQAFRLRVEAAKMEVAARRHSTTAIPEHAVRDSYRRRTKSVFERHRSNSITEDLVGGDSRCPLECEHQRILSGERSEQNLTMIRQSAPWDGVSILSVTLMSEVPLYPCSGVSRSC